MIRKKDIYKIEFNLEEPTQEQKEGGGFGLFAKVIQEIRGKGYTDESVLIEHFFTCDKVGQKMIYKHVFKVGDVEFGVLAENVMSESEFVNVVSNEIIEYLQK